MNQRFWLMWEHLFKYWRERKKFEWKKKKNVILDKANVSIREQRHPRLLFQEPIL